MVSEPSQFTRKSRPVPAGLVTFLFTDVEGSSTLWENDPIKTAQSVQIHDEIVHSTVANADGFLFGWAGDHFRAAFSNPQTALNAALSIRSKLSDVDWDDGPPLRVRIGVHRGQVASNGGDYVGVIPNQAGRLESIAFGGQILISSDVAELAESGLKPLGLFRLRALPEPILIYQVAEPNFVNREVLEVSASREYTTQQEKHAHQELVCIGEVLQTMNLLGASQRITFTKTKLQISYKNKK